jgi:hypothetical protein
MNSQAQIAGAVTHDHAAHGLDRAPEIGAA